jgi:hypothetical protein
MCPGAGVDAWKTNKRSCLWQESMSRFSGSLVRMCFVGSLTLLRKDDSSRVERSEYVFTLSIRTFLCETSSNT